MSQTAASTGTPQHLRSGLSAIDISIPRAMALVLMYPAVHSLLTVAMLVAAKRSSQIQGFNFTTAEVIAATHPLGLAFGLIVAGLFIGGSYFGSRNTGVTLFRMFVREYLDASWRMHLAAGAIGSLILLSYLGLWMLLSGADARRAPDDIQGTAGLVFWIISVVVLVPVVEEILFRGVLFRALARRFGSTVFILASTVAFTAAHFISIGEDWRVAGSICLQGLAASAICAWSERLGPCITLHACYNAVAVLWVVTA